MRYSFLLMSTILLFVTAPILAQTKVAIISNDKIGPVANLIAVAEAELSDVDGIALLDRSRIKVLRSPSSCLLGR